MVVSTVPILQSGIGTSITGAYGISASTLSSGRTILYSITNTMPATAAPYISIDAISGNVMVATGAPGPLAYNYAWSYPTGYKTAILLNITAYDSAMPWLRDNGTVIVNLVQIKPRITSNLNATVQRTAVAGASLLTMAATTPYTPSNILYGIAVNGYDATSLRS